jgi:hypothetical protein
MSLPIRFDSTETGAPTLNNANGSMIALARALLVNGFNVKSITAIVVASGVATVQCPTHGYACGYGQQVKITGASVPALNGSKQPTLVDANYFTFPAPGVADGSYTATDARRAPLGWVEDFADGGSTKAIYSRSAPAANPISLRIDDSGSAPATTSGSRVIMVTGATGVDTYTAQAPTNAQVSGGLVATKVANTATAKQWIAIGTDLDFFLFVADSGATQYLPAICFFDGVAYRAGDAYFTVLAGTSGSSVSGVSNSLFIQSSLHSAPSAPSSGVIFSDELGIGTPEPFGAQSPFKASGGHGDTGASQPADPLDFSIGFDAYIRGAKAGARGTIPGNGEPFIRVTAMTEMGVFLVQDTDNGGKVLLIKVAYTGTNAGMTAFKLSEAWH